MEPLALPFWKPLLVYDYPRSLDAITGCEGSINQGWTNAMQNPSPRRTQHKMLENAPEMCVGQIAMNPVGSVNSINEENTKHDSPAKVPWYMCKALPTPSVNAQDLFA